MPAAREPNHLPSGTPLTVNWGTHTTPAVANARTGPNRWHIVGATFATNIAADQIPDSSSYDPTTPVTVTRAPATSDEHRHIARTAGIRLRG